MRSNLVAQLMNQNTYLAIIASFAVRVDGCHCVDGSWKGSDDADFDISSLTQGYDTHGSLSVSGIMISPYGHHADLNYFRLGGRWFRFVCDWAGSM